MTGKEEIIKRMQEDGKRITHQRELMLDIILSGQCASCKEVFYEASRRDPGIGRATVYRMIALLEEMGVIKRGDGISLQEK